MELYLGLDVGTQGTKGLVFDLETSRVVARASSSYDLIGGLAPGAAEQHPETWIDAVRAVAAELARSLGPAWSGVRALGVSGQQHGCVVLDSDRRVVRPAKLWCDTETAAEARELSERLGRAVPTGFTASKLLWLARHEPENWRRTRHVLLPHDFVNARLCGELAMECGDASGTGFFDVHARRFDDRAVAAIDGELAAKLPRLLDTGASVGALDRAGAELLGLPLGVPVSAGAGDNMASAIGAGATRSGVVVVSLGTSATVFARSERPLVDPEGLIAPFCDSTGAWLPLLCVMNATGVLEEVRSAFGVDHATLTREAAAEPLGARGLVCIPYLQGERVPDLPRATGALLGLRPGLLRRGLLYRAALEGVTANLAWGVARLTELGVDVSRVRVVGGGASNPLWRELLADALDVEVETLVESESGALGAALQAAWTLRRATEKDLPCDALAAVHVRTSGAPVRPDPERVARWRGLVDRFRIRVREVAEAADPAEPRELANS
ncbi:MAG: xylulokinase [Planctomycetes bacterium]|nr:xylulokinase [Planctomycetota bacterium]